MIAMVRGRYTAVRGTKVVQKWRNKTMKLLKFSCTKCSKPIAEEVFRGKSSVIKRIVACEGALLKKYKGLAARVKCACGQQHVLLKGSV